MACAMRLIHGWYIRVHKISNNQNAANIWPHFDLISCFEMNWHSKVVVITLNAAVLGGVL
jgi:hypothetical protein